jgi:peptidoglycan hydrolase-like protein with peptidoglycan-binding domain
MVATTGLSAVSAAYFDYGPAPRCDVHINRELRRGSEGVEVSVLQDFLNRAGLLSATPNGYFGPATTAAIRAFQSQNYISATGVVGPATRNAINERMCDTDLRGDSLSYYGGYSNSYYGYSSGVTYVDPQDPFVKVISPSVSTPVVYSTPQTPVVQTPPLSPPAYNPTIFPIAPGTTNTSFGSTNIVYSPSLGYTYGIIPASGMLTVSTPRTNSVYNEGDTVYVAWETNNINANGYAILLENSSTNQSKTVMTVNGNSASFVLTKELLDAVCSGTCTGSYGGYQDSFRIAITTPIRDIAGNVSTLRAAISPITIKRPFAGFGTVSVTTSKTPVNSGELFKLYVNIPTGASWNSNLYGQYSIKLRANCPSGVTASIAGAQCGQDFTIPFGPTFFQSEIPVMVGNTTWYRQDVTFTLTVTNLAGQQIGTASAVVQVNGAPFSW